MTSIKTHRATYNFTQRDAAFAYALAAERIFAEDPTFVDANEALKPIIVSHLFQSLEISLKHAGIASELFTEREARAGTMRSGHGIKELAQLATERLGSKDVRALILALTCRTNDHNSQDVLRKMITSAEFERTRESYARRCLGYAEVQDGDFCIMTPVEVWIAAVKDVAHNIDSAVQVIRQWKASSPKSSHFAIWFRSELK